GYGFDNVADVLSVSPALLERYLSAARVVSRRAVGDLNLKPVLEEYETRRGIRGRPERVSDALPFDSAGGISVEHYFPLDAEYTIRVRLSAGENAPAPLEIKIPIKAGLRTVGATFLRESAKPEVAAVAARGVTLPGAPPRGKLDIRLDGARL